MRSLVLTALCAAVHLALPGAAHADRASMPLEAPAIGAAVADEVVVGTVTAVTGSIATVTIVETLKSTSTATAVGSSIQVEGVIAGSGPMRHGGVGVAVGKTYAFLVWRPSGAIATFVVVDRYGGTIDDSPSVRAILRAGITAGHPHSGWLTGKGIDAQLILDPQALKAGEVDLFVLLRNTAAKPRAFRFRDWPRKKRSQCSLTMIERSTGKRVAAKDAPISRKEIAAYFSRHGRSYEMDIASGDTWIFRLPRVTTAAPGWGYKEELGFRFYPITTPGAYEISAECVNLLGPKTRVSTPSLVLSL